MRRMSNESSDDRSELQGLSITTGKIRYEVLLSLVSFLVTVVYAYASIQFRIEAQERAILSLCDKINILLAAKGEPYKLECRDK
jgi:hypothetical protein